MTIYLFKSPPDVIHNINKGFIINGQINPTANNICADDNFLVDIWEHLKTVLVASAEYVFDILSYLEERLRKNFLLWTNMMKACALVKENNW